MTMICAWSRPSRGDPHAEGSTGRALFGVWLEEIDLSRWPAPSG